MYLILVKFLPSNLSFMPPREVLLIRKYVVNENWFCFSVLKLLTEDLDYQWIGQCLTHNILSIQLFFSLFLDLCLYSQFSMTTLRRRLLSNFILIEFSPPSRIYTVKILFVFCPSCSTFNFKDEAAFSAIEALCFLKQSDF